MWHTVLTYPDNSKTVCLLSRFNLTSSSESLERERNLIGKNLPRIRVLLRFCKGRGFKKFIENDIIHLYKDRVL